jgi:hypothetical protein
MSTRAQAVILPDLEEAVEHPVEVGWKIYPFPPVFWRRAAVQRSAPELIYYGPLPQSRTALAQLVGMRRPAYIYVIQDDEGDVLYVGKSVNPESRLTTHRRTKEWWPETGMLTLLAVWAEDRSAADALAFLIEAIAIRDAGPKFNIAGVVR